MKIELFFELPEQAKEIRNKVFVEEQGFWDEFDETDTCAAHFLLMRWGKPVGVCRVFEDRENGRWILGRLAVLKKYRGRGLGGKLVRAAEEYVRGVGGKQLHLHAQCQAEAFYKKQGYTAYGEVEPEQDSPHIWMQKTVF